MRLGQPVLTWEALSAPARAQQHRCTLGLSLAMERPLHLPRTAASTEGEVSPFLRTKQNTCEQNLLFVTGTCSLQVPEMNTMS